MDRRHESPNLRIFHDQEIKRRCAVLAFPPRILVVTPALLGPGSDIRMMMGWNIESKTEKSEVWFFPRWTGYGRDHISLHGRFLGLPRVLCWHGTAIGPQAGKRCWPLLIGLWRAIAPLMKPWCAEGDMPTAANLNLYMGRAS